MRSSIRWIPLWVLILCHSSVQTKLFSDAEEERGENQSCFRSMTDGVGNIHLSALGFRSCTWFIHHENATSLHILFQSSLQKKNSANDSLRYYVYAFTKNPQHSKDAVDAWRSDEGSLVRTYEGTKLWLIVHPDTFQTSKDHNSNSNTLISYAAQIRGFNVSCNNTLKLRPYNGKFIKTTDGLGSTGELHCNEGFVLRGGTGKFICSAIGNSLAWLSDGSFCESICTHPLSVPDATFDLQISTNASMETTLGNDTKSDTMITNNSVVGLHSINSIVKYTCKEPYVTHGEATLRCESDKSGVPRWSSLPPVCLIPHCSSTTILANATGAIVNPSYPSKHLIGGSLSCKWEIRAPAGSVISLYFGYVNIPSSEDVRLVIFDANTMRPVQIAIFTGTSDPRSITSDTSKVIVIYQGPALDMSGYEGFYIKYKVKSSYYRLRRAANTATSSVFSSDSSVSASFTSSVSSASKTFSSPESSVRTSFASPQLSASSVFSSTESIEVPTSTAPLMFETVSKTALTSQSTSNRRMTTSDPDLHTEERARPTESTQDTIANIVTTPATYPSQKPTYDDSNDDWKIAVGIVIPLLSLIIVLVGVYIMYRKKYPVRMIIGREFGKFSNPDYTRPRQVPTLVREDADDYFTRSSGDISTVEFNPIDNRIQFDNLAFEKDEGDEDEKERKFLERKSWLFRKNSSDGEMSSVKDSDDAEESKVKKSKAKETKRTESMVSTDTEIAEMLDEQKLTPKPKRRVKKRAKVEKDEEAASHGRSDGKSSASDISSTSPKGVKGKLPTASTISLSSMVGNPEPDPQTILDKIEHEGESNYLKTAKIIFEQPSFEEVCAEVKARSRSMSVDQPRLNPRPRSFSVDPSKSARRASLHDETIMAAHLRSLAAYRKANATAKPLESPQLSAAVVGVDIRMRSASSYSSDSSLSQDDLNTEKRDRGLTISSANSNPHLVTDLDDSFENNPDSVYEDDTGQNIIHKTSKMSDLRLSDDETTEQKHSKDESVIDHSTLNAGKVNQGHPHADELGMHKSGRDEGDEVKSPQATDSYQLHETKSSRTSSYSSKDDDDENDLSYAVFSTLKMPHGEGSFQDNVDNNEHGDGPETARLAADVSPAEELVDSILSSVLPSKISEDTKSIGSNSTEDETSVMDESKKSEEDNVYGDEGVQRLSPGSESGSNQDNDDRVSPVQVPLVSAVGINLSFDRKEEKTQDTESLDPSKNKIKILRIGSKTEMDHDDDVNDDGHIRDETHVPDGTDSKNKWELKDKRKIQFKLPERKHSRSSSDASNHVSSVDSYSVSSDDDMGQTSYDFMAAAEPQETNGDGVSGFETYKLDTTHDAEPTPVPSSLQFPAGAEASWQEILPGKEDEGVAKQKIISEIKFSDSSSDSSDIIVIGSREMPSSTQIIRPESHSTSGGCGQTSKHISLGRTDNEDVHSDISECDSDDDYQITDADLAEILESSSDDERRRKDRKGSEDSVNKDLAMPGEFNFDFKDKAVYTFKEDNSEDEDVDV